jgi:SAM-dependent methyltransferase
MAPERFDTLLDFLGGADLSGRDTLEIGCADGRVMLTLKDALNLGDVDGLDPSPLIEQPVFPFRNKVRGTINDIARLGAKYGLVVAIHVLEHLEDPLSALVTIRKSLQEDGLIFIEVPHRSGHPRFLLEENPSHEHFFSIESFSRILAEADLELVNFRTGGWLSRRCSDTMYGLARSKNSKLELLPMKSLRILPSWLEHDRVVVWGAGMPSLAEIGSYISRSAVVGLCDSNPNLWGTVRAGWEVLAPDQIRSLEPTLLFINSEVHEAEIETSLKSLYPHFSGTVATLREALEVE